jgi:predicted secreted protein
MNLARFAATLALAVSAAAPLSALAQSNVPVTQPVISVTASTTAPLANDRMLAWLRIEVDNADPVAAANEVNTKMGKALARAKAVKGVDATTTSYTSYQVSERNQPSKWRVSQTLSLEGSDFGALSALVTKIQGEDGLVLSGMSFSVSTAARRAAEDALTQQAIKAWQARAQAAAQGFGAASWRPGHVTVQAGDTMVRPQPMMRAAAGTMASAPVAAEAGTSDITVTVSGEAILEPARAR